MHLILNLVLFKNCLNVIESSHYVRRVDNASDTDFEAYILSSQRAYEFSLLNLDTTNQ